MFGKIISNHIPVLLGVFALFHTGFSKEKVVQNTWTSLPVAIDAEEDRSQKIFFLAGCETALQEKSRPVNLFRH
jgi:hypothetical protein